MSGRKRRGSFEDDEYRRDTRPHFQKRQRLPPVVQLCKEMMPDITTIGESPKAFDDDIKFLSEAIANEFGHEEYFNDALLKTFRAVILEQPHKQVAIALLTIVVNSLNEIAGKSIINYFFNELQNAVNESIVDNLVLDSNETGPWNKCKLILRFLSILTPIIQIDDILTIYKQFFDLAIELNNLDPQSRSPLGELLYTNTLLNIPYLFYFNKENETLRNKVEEFIIHLESNFTVKPVQVDLLSVYNSNAPYEIVELPQVVLQNVKRAMTNNVEQLNQLFIDWSHLLPAENYEQNLNDALQLPNIEILQNFAKLDKDMGSVDSMWRTPNYIFHIYLSNTNGDDFETVVPITTYAGQLFKDIYIDIVESLEFNRNEVAKQLLLLGNFFQDKIFADAGISIADLMATYEEDPLITTYKIEDLAIETVLSLIFKLPTVSQPFAYLYTLLVDICQNAPKAIAPVFGRAFRFFYKNIDNLDLELKLRFLDWFSIQMSNFNFSWKWNEWENDSKRFSKSFYNPKITFIRNLIRKELRLTSTPQEVDKNLPEEFKQYLDTSYFTKHMLVSFYQLFFNDINITEEHVKKNDLFFKEEFVPFSTITLELLDYIHTQNENRDITNLENLITKLRDEYGTKIKNFEQLIVVWITQSVIHCGSRSLSHANKYINDLQQDMKTVFDKLEIDKVEKEMLIIQSVLAYWNINSQNGFLIVDALKYAEIISVENIFKFCLHDWDGKNYGFTDVTCVDAIFRNLSEQLTMETINLDHFEKIFEKICMIINETVSQLNINNNEVIQIPEINDDTEIDPVNDLPRLELLWKYSMSMSFVKSLLRKYSKQYTELHDQLASNMSTAILHEATRTVLSKWVDEVSKI